MKRPLEKEHASENVSVGILIVIAGDVYFFEKENCRPTHVPIASSVC